MTHDCGFYLSSYETMTIFHMRDMVSGQRTKIKQTNVKHITVPNFEGLTLETMLEYAAQHQNVMAALPLILREREKLSRGYVANVIYTIVGNPFKTWVDQRVNERHQVRR